MKKWKKITAENKKEDITLVFREYFACELLLCAIIMKNMERGIEMKKQTKKFRFSEKKLKQLYERAKENLEHRYQELGLKMGNLYGEIAADIEAACDGEISADTIRRALSENIHRQKAQMIADYFQINLEDYRDKSRELNLLGLIRAKKMVHNPLCFGELDLPEAGVLNYELDGDICRVTFPIPRDWCEILEITYPVQMEIQDQFHEEDGIDEIEDLLEAITDQLDGNPDILWRSAIPGVAMLDEDDTEALNELMEDGLHDWKIEELHELGEDAENPYSRENFPRTQMAIQTLCMHLRMDGYPEEEIRRMLGRPELLNSKFAEYHIKSPFHF